MLKFLNLIAKMPTIKPIASKSFLDALEAIKDIQKLSNEIADIRQNEYLKKDEIDY